ncbi:MAG: sortase, partial [Rhodoglobus sp.]
MRIRVFSAAVALGLGLSLAASGASAVTDPVTVPAITTASAATQVAIIAPLTVPTGSGGLISAELLAEYTGTSGLLTRQLDAVAGKPVAVAVDPMILASIRVLGTSAPQSARAWLQRLSLIGNEVVPLPYANSDPTLATQSGQSSMLEPISFDFAL